jgi:hypothetical protein
MKRILILLSVVVLLLTLATVAIARIAGYDLTWWTADGGGGNSAGNGYSLNGTIGQPDAGTIASGGGYTLAGGFWHGGVTAPAQTKVYLPLTTKP